uniref:Uncharacterized LOC112161483 n=1 Tax=Oryzias melastigma TaxID=30732 RepID=A0A3B3B5B9_ORYME
MGFLLGLCVLAVAVEFVKTEETLQNKEFALDGTLKLRPVNPPTPITSMTWKHEGNLLVEQYSSTAKPEYYGQFKDRTSLVFSTGEITISKLKLEDGGKYTIEINNVIQDVGFQVKFIKEVPVPTVDVKPLACSETSDSCSLHCEGNVDSAGTVSYFWKGGDQDWKKSTTKKLEIKNDADTRKIKEFFCKVENSVSEKESAAELNPFYKEEEAGLSVGAVVGIVFVFILIIVAVFGVAVLFYKKMFCFKNCQKETDTTKPNGITGEEGVKLTEPTATGAGSGPAIETTNESA